MNKNNVVNAKIFKAFSDETRLTVLSVLQVGEKCANDLLEQVSISQSTLSHHMKILVDSGIVTARKEGKRTYYSVSNKGCKKAADILNGFISNIADVPPAKKEPVASQKNILPKKSLSIQLL